MKQFDIYSNPERMARERILVAHFKAQCVALSGGEKNPFDAAYDGCQILPECFDKMLLDSSPVRAMFLNGTDTGSGNLREFSVACFIRGDWNPMPGKDVHKITYTNGPYAAGIEVRGCSPGTGKNDWPVNITDEKCEFQSDWLVVECMEFTFNPCYASLFAIPGEVVREKIKQVKADRKRKGLDENARKVKIGIPKRKPDHRYASLRKDNWWPYRVEDYAHLESVIAGDVLVGSMRESHIQLSFINLVTSH